MRWSNKIFPVLNASSGRDWELFVPLGNSIPRIIHQTFPSRDLPIEIRQRIDQTLFENPGWEHRLYDDGEIVKFIKANYGSVILEYFNRINPAYGAARADLFRYLLMYKVGGVYLDIKSYPEKRLDDVLRSDDQFLLSYWKNGSGQRYERWGMHYPELRHGEFQQWHIIAVPGHPFLRAAIRNVLNNIDKYNPGLHGTGRMGVLRVTGPIAYTLAIEPLLGKFSHRFADSEDELGLEYSIYGKIADQSHQDIFKSHYTNLKEPVVAVSRGVMAVAFAVRVLKKMRNFICVAG